MKTKSAAWWQEKLDKFQAEGRARTKHTGLYFDDEFGPSFSIAEGEAPENWVNSKSRPVFHNHHIFDFLGLAIEVAEVLGADPLIYGFPITFTEIGYRDYKTGLQRATSIVEKLPPESPEWLAVTCYIQWLAACYCATLNKSVQEIAKWMFLAGATARELELSIINRTHASRGRTTIKGASEGGRNRKLYNKARNAEIVAEMQRLQEAKPHLGVKWAAEQAFKNGVGTSGKANRGCWYRNNPNSK